MAQSIIYPLSSRLLRNVGLNLLLFAFNHLSGLLETVVSNFINRVRSVADAILRCKWTHVYQWKVYPWERNQVNLGKKSETGLKRQIYRKRRRKYHTSERKKCEREKER